MIVPIAFVMGRAFRRAMWFVIGGIPAAVILAWYNVDAFGSLFASGYEAGGATRDFALSYFAPRALHYARWTVEQFSPIAILAAIGGLVISKARWMLASWFAAFFVFYSFYLWYDEWWYTRFLLPAYPAIAIAAGIAFAWLVERRRIAGVLLLVIALTWEGRQLARFNVLWTDEDQALSRVPVEWVARALPPRSLVFSMEFSGALLYYSDHRPVRWDTAPATIPIAPPLRAADATRGGAVSREVPEVRARPNRRRRERCTRRWTTAYNPRRMSDRTERTFAPEPREPSRRRFMIAGEHVILRAFERDDAERCYRWMNDPNIVRTLKSRYPIAFQNEIEWLDRAMHGSADRSATSPSSARTTGRTSATRRSTTSTGSRASRASACSSASRARGTAASAATPSARWCGSRSTR